VKIGGSSPPLLIAHVYGTAEQMGVAQGQLLKSQIGATIDGLYKFVEEQIDTFVVHWPKELQRVIEQLGVDGLDVVLDLELLATRPYSPKHYFDEVRGLANGTGRSYDELLRVQMFPELVKAHCSMFGAWDSASVDGNLVQLRALDWATNTPFQQFPLLLIYHPSDGSNTFATLGWPGLIGAITGLNNAPLGICEKVWLNYAGQSSRFGQPWNWVLRDVLQFDKTNAQAIHRIQNAHRTCSIFTGVGSRADNSFAAIEYSYENATVWTAATQPVYKNHPNITDVVWIDKHPQPDTKDPCLGNLLQQYHGAIDADVILHNITSVFETGNMHIAIYSYGTPLTMHIANAAPVNNAGVATPAYEEPFVKLNMDIEFARPNPQP
jgi:hypothetical protein